jgi:hypothetical protein
VTDRLPGDVMLAGRSLSLSHIRPLALSLSPNPNRRLQIDHTIPSPLPKYNPESRVIPKALNQWEYLKHILLTISDSPPTRRVLNVF